jgi:hypothetical protein
MLATAALLAAAGRAQEREPFEEAPINYSATSPHDRVTQINEKFARQADEIRGLPAKKRLRWLLEQLEVPLESQLLVFSKTSLQRNLINPETPRALFFSDEAYVGWSVGGGFEVTVFDAELGATFYIFDQHEAAPAPLLARSGECLLCHSRHAHTPSLRTRSVFPDANGEPLSGSGGSNIEPSTPLSERWGGWYVSGAESPLRHLGNITGQTLGDFEGPAAKSGRTLPSLKGLVDTHRYPLNTSDIVALLLHDHQVHVHNVLASANQDARIALYRWPAMREILGLPADAPPAGSCLVVFNSQADKVIEALMCKGEAPFPAGGIHGDGVFERAYARTRKADGKNRSLRDLELNTRIFRYRCSPLIYSQSFATLPKQLRSIILGRLSAGLRAFPPSENFAHLDEAERVAIHEILTATLPDLPPEWGK